MLFRNNERKIICKNGINNIKNILEIYKSSLGINEMNKEEIIEKFQLIKIEEGNNIITFKLKVNNELKNIIISMEKEKKYLNTIKMKHKIINNKVNIFHKKFITKNYRKCKIICKGKEYNLIDKFNNRNRNKKILSIKLKGISNLTNIYYLFRDCDTLISLPDIDKWNTKNITDMSYIFCNCKSLISLSGISKWNTDKVTTMNRMFTNCKSLISLPDISNWNTINVIDMTFMFLGCESLLSFPDISKWNISNVKDVSKMFCLCALITSLPDISKWNTSSIVNMEGLFSLCSSLLTLPDISKWNISNVINISSMFLQCSSLSSLPDISISK